MVIVEYCKYGNLSNYLKSKRDLFFLNKVRNFGVGGLGYSSIKQEKPVFFFLLMTNLKTQSLLCPSMLIPHTFRGQCRDYGIPVYAATIRG